MKAILLVAFVLMLTAGSYAQQKITPAAPGVTYGKAVTADNAITVADLPESLKDKTIYTGKVTGTVTEVCTKKGCFMKLAQAGGDGIMIRFKDYAYFMPQNIVGKTVVVEGVTTVTTTPIAQLQHWAEDAGKSEQEIAAIKTPKKDMEIMADGVLVVK